MYVNFDNISIDYINGLSKEDKKKLEREYKNWLIRSGKYQNYKNLVYVTYSKFCAENYGTEINKAVEEYLSADLNFTECELKYLDRIYQAYRSKVKRLKKKLKYIISNYNTCFLTLTFNDDYLTSTCRLTRRKYISEYLRSLKVPFYVANIDFGDKDKNPYSKGREHYHAVVQTDYVNLKSYLYGFIFSEKITTSDKSVIRISKYINKLTNHSYKTSTGLEDRLIYSR